MPTVEIIEGTIQVNVTDNYTRIADLIGKRFEFIEGLLNVQLFGAEIFLAGTNKPPQTSDAGIQPPAGFFLGVGIGLENGLSVRADRLWFRNLTAGSNARVVLFGRFRQVT